MRGFFAAAIAIACVIAFSDSADARPRKTRSQAHHSVVSHVDDSRYIGSGGMVYREPVRGLKRAGRTVARHAARASKRTARTIAGYAQSLATGVNNARAEASLTPALREVVADLRAKHGADCVIVEGGRSDRAIKGGKRRSCHWGGQAFDGRLCAAARDDVRSRPSLGSITYSGAMSHDHVSLCRMERGLRTHLVVNGKGVPVRYAKKKKRRSYYAAAQ